MTQWNATRMDSDLNLREKFVQLELYKSLLANAGRFVYYEQADNQGCEEKEKRQY